MSSSWWCRLLHRCSQHQDVNRLQYPDSQEQQDPAAVSPMQLKLAVTGFMEGEGAETPVATVHIVPLA